MALSGLSNFTGKIRNSINAFTTDSVLVDRKQHNAEQGNYEAILRTYDQAWMDNNSRSSLSTPYLDTPSGSKIPIMRLSPIRLFNMADDIGDLRIVFETIQRMMFKNGAKVIPTFKYKCLKCLKEFDEKPLAEFKPMQEQLPNDKSPNSEPQKGAEPNNEKKPPFAKAFPPKKEEDKPTNPAKSDGKPFPPKKDQKFDPMGNPKQEELLECDECGNDDPKFFDKPNPTNRAIVQAVLNIPANHNKQSIITVGRSYERDMDVVDGAYCLVSKKYKMKLLSEPDPLTGATAIVDDSMTEIVEYLRLNPIQVNLVADNEGRLGYDSTKKPVWICPDYTHRDKRLERPFCDRCGCRAFNGILEANAVPYGMPISDPKKMIYAEEEIIWTAGKFYPDVLYGYSPIQAIWKKAMSLFHQDEYIWKYFDKDRPPKSLLMIGSRNYESAQAFMERQRMGARSDPYMPRIVTVNNEDTNKGVNFIDLTPNFKELELSELRGELRQVIWALYGITPILGGASSSGGLGNEGLQITISNNVMKWYQRIFNEEFFDQITKRMLKIHDWKIVLEENEEIDELRREQIKGEKIKNAKMMFDMGFEVWTDGNGKIMNSQFPNPEKQAMNAKSGGFGGQMGSAKQTDGGVKDEKSTNFGGEPLPNRPSDEGGQGSGAPDSGFSHSGK